MNIINYLLLLLVGLAFIVLLVGFVLVITRNVRQGMLFRQKIARRMEHLRMEKMLRALGLDLSSYLHNVPASQVLQSAKRCEECSTVDVCDAQLAKGKLETDEIDFCPNQSELSQFEQAEKQRSGSQS